MHCSDLIVDLFLGQLTFPQARILNYKFHLLFRLVSGTTRGFPFALRFVLTCQLPVHLCLQGSTILFPSLPASCSAQLKTGGNYGSNQRPLPECERSEIEKQTEGNFHAHQGW